MKESTMQKGGMKSKSNIDNISTAPGGRSGVTTNFHNGGF